MNGPPPAPRRPAPFAPEAPPSTDAVSAELLTERTDCEDLLLGPADCGGADLRDRRVERSALRGVFLAGAHLGDSRWRDVELTDGDLSGVLAPRAAFTRVALARCRADGMALVEAALQHVRFVECRLRGANLRASTLLQCVFERCDLAEADFGEARLDGVGFDACDLSRADFTGVATKSTFLGGSTVDGVRGVPSLRGVVVSPEQVLPLAVSAFSTLGLVVEDDS